MDLMRRFLIISSCCLLLCGGSLLPFSTHAASTLSERLSGRILLQVESRGEAWYVDPVTKQRFYLGTSQDAFTLLRSKGLGIRHAELQRYIATRFPARLAGRILIDVDDRGQAYYVLPHTLRAARLGNAEETYTVLRQTGLGITTRNLAQIRIAPGSSSASVNAPSVNSPPLPTTTFPPSLSPYATLEEQTHASINAHRVSIGLSPLVWDSVVAEVARIHSEDMAAGRVAFGHDGFNQRFEQINLRIRLSRMAENVAANTYEDPVATAVQGWLNSPGHRINIENSNYTHTGIGVAKGAEDEYFLTQLFTRPLDR